MSYVNLILRPSQRPQEGEGEALPLLCKHWILFHRASREGTFTEWLFDLGIALGVLSVLILRLLVVVLLLLFLLLFVDKKIRENM